MIGPGLPSPTGRPSTRTMGSTSDVVPATFYLVVVEDADTDECSGLSGAWPVGFIRADAGTPTTPAPTTP